MTDRELLVKALAARRLDQTCEKVDGVVRERAVAMITGVVKEGLR